MNKNQEELAANIYTELKRQYKGRLPPNLRISELASAILFAGYVKLSDAELDIDAIREVIHKLEIMEKLLPSEVVMIAYAIVQAKGIIKCK